MKSILFLVLLASASALPSAVVLPASEIQERESAWLRANPSGFAKVMTSKKEYGAGDSMRPLIQPADVMLYEAYVHQPVKGQAVSINRGKHTIPMTHLVIDETEHMVLTKGINNKIADGWTSKAWINGVLVGILRKE